jgi:hypothetical protein
MAKDNVEQQNEERNVKLDEMLKTLQKAKEEEQESQQRLEASDKLNYALQERGNELNFAQANAINELLDSMNSEGQDAEQRKEDTARAEKLLDLLGDIANNTEDLGNISGPVEAASMSILSLPGLILGLGAGLVVGIASSFTTLIKLLGKGLLKAVAPIVKSVLRLWKTLFGGVFKLLNKIPFVKSFTSSVRGFFSNLGGRFTKAGKSISQAFKPLTNGIKNIKSAFTAGFSGLKSFRTASGQFAKLGKIGNIGKGIAQGLKNVSNAAAGIKNSLLAPFKQIGKDLAPIKKLMPSGGASKIMKPAIDTFKRVMSVMRSVTKAAFGFGRILGKLFLPITIIMSVFDTFKGALSGFDKYKDKGFLEGIIGGLFGGISGLLTGLIGMPLDLLKSGVSWIASKLGFENFSEQLDAFSFSDMISNLFTSITDTIVGFIGSIKDSIADIGIGATIANVALEMLKIFKKIATFPLAVAAGAVAGLAAAWPGGDSPGEAFMKGFNKVQSFGDAQIDSMKIQGDGMTESGEEIKQTSAENAQGQASNNANAAANVTAAAINNSKSSSSVTTNVNMSPQNRTAATIAGPYG